MPVRSTNPCLDKTGQTRTRNSIVGMLDILGFTSEMMAAYQAGTANQLLERLREALTVASEAFNEDMPGLEADDST